MFDLSKSFFLPPTFGLPLRLFRGSSFRLCLILSDIDHSNSLRSTLYRTTSSVSRYPFTFFFLSIYSPILVRPLFSPLLRFLSRSTPVVATHSPEMSIPALLFIRLTPPQVQLYPSDRHSRADQDGFVHHLLRHKLKCVVEIWRRYVLSRDVL